MTITPPVRHLRTADLLALGADGPNDVAEHLPFVLIAPTRQQQLLTTSPKAVTEDETAGIFSRSMELW
jgi:hydroxyacid-oxoacid transhydrogenase